MYIIHYNAHLAIWKNLKNNSNRDSYNQFLKKLFSYLICFFMTFFLFSLDGTCIYCQPCQRNRSILFKFKTEIGLQSENQKGLLNISV